MREASSLGPLHAGQVIAALLAAQALALSPSAAGERPAAAPGSRAVRRPRGVAPPVVEAARRAVQPLRPAATSLAKLQRQLARAGASSSSSPPDERSARIEAERAFRRGVQLLGQSAFGGALKAFAVACERNADEPEYRMFEAWTQVLALKDENARSAARAQTQVWARRVLERDRDSLRAHTILGQLATAAGEFDAAERHFRIALRVAPDDRDAQRGLRAVDRRRSEAPQRDKTAKPKRR